MSATAMLRNSSGVLAEAMLDQPKLVLLFMMALAATTHAQLPVPQLKSIFPVGAKLGTTTDIELGGSNLDETTRLYFSDPGISAQSLPEEKSNIKRFRVVVDGGVRVGDYDVRSIGKLGISNPRTFVVSDSDQTTEREPNNQNTDATRVALNVTVNGRISPAEDVDWFVFPAKQGQRVLIECRAWRIDSRLDGFMWLYNSQNKQLAVSQDEDIRNEKRDPMIDFDVPADGDYFLKLTDFTYNGSDEYFYRLSITTLPYIDFILPSAAKPGSDSAISLFGRNLSGEKTGLVVNGRPLEKLVQQITVPENPDVLTSLRVHDLIRPPASRLDGTEIRVKSDTGGSNDKLLLFSRSLEVAEQEPNDQTNQAQRLSIPCSVTGQFSPAKDLDYYVFNAKKDEKISIEVLAERIGSPADPDMEILKADGQVIANPQDDGDNIGQIRFTSNSRDLIHRFTAPADGDYTLRLEHLFRQAQGGPQYVYRLELRRDPTPDFRLICQPADEIKIDSHVVYQGGRQRLDILVWRLYGHDEPISVEAFNLPVGVTAEPIVIGRGVKWGTLVVTAKADATIGESELQIVGTSEVRKEKLIRKARGGVIVWDTVNTPAISRMIRSIMLAVREGAPFALTAFPAQLTVQKGDAITLTVSVKRREDMSNAIQLNGAGYQLPPGMEIPLTNVGADQTEATLVLKTDKIPVGTFSFLINGDGQVPSTKDKNIRCVYPSNTVTVTIEPKNAK